MVAVMTTFIFTIILYSIAILIVCKMKNNLTNIARRYLTSVNEEHTNETTTRYTACSNTE